MPNHSYPFCPATKHTYCNLSRIYPSLVINVPTRNCLKQLTFLVLSKLSYLVSQL